jgi:hypothetical protein
MPVSLRESEVFAPPPRHRGKPERSVQRAILLHLRARGCLVAVTDAGAAYRAGAFFGDSIPAGWPDITGVLPSGRFLGVECKAPGGRQSPVQKAMEEAVHKHNGIYILAKSVDDVEKELNDAAFDRQDSDGRRHATADEARGGDR